MARAIPNHSTTDHVTFGGITSTGVVVIESGVHEAFSSKTAAGSGGAVTHDCSAGQIFYHTSVANNFTVNLVNLDLSNGYATTVCIIIAQGATAYIPNAIQIDGVAQTLNWQGNSIPTGTVSRNDVATFSILNNSGTYIVLGQLTGF